MSFDERFELLERLQDGDVQTFQARERATGRAVEVHLSASPEMLAKLESASTIDRGRYEGMHYIVTPVKTLDSGGAWQIQAALKPQAKESPGDFTRMFELRQAPEPAPVPAAKVVDVPAPSQPGEFTRVFNRPAAAAPVASAMPGGQGEFTRMFQQPVPTPPTPASQIVAAPGAAKSGVPVGLIVAVVAILSAIAVFLLVRTLY